MADVNQGGTDVCKHQAAVIAIETGHTGVAGAQARHGQVQVAVIVIVAPGRPPATQPHNAGRHRGERPVAVVPVEVGAVRAAAVQPGREQVQVTVAVGIAPSQPGDPDRGQARADIAKGMAAVVAVDARLMLTGRTAGHGQVQIAVVVVVPPSQSRGPHPR